MTRRAFIVLLAATALLAAAPVADAARRPRTPKGPTGTYQGTITKVAGNSIQVNVSKDQDKPKVMSFWLDKTSSVTGGGKRGTIDDLREGQSVTVKAKNGKAESVEVQVPGEAAPSDKEKKKKK